MSNDRERSDAAHDPTIAIAKFELTEEQMDRFYAVLRHHDDVFNRLASQFQESTLALAAAKYAADRSLCSLIAILGEGRK